MADQILRSYSNTAPSFLEDGQLAYSFVANTLYIGKSVDGVNSVVQIIDSDITKDLQTVFNAANNAQNTATLASVNTVTLKVEVDAVEANVDYLFGIQTTQNNSITYASNKANSAYELADIANTLATTAAANALSANVAAQSALSTVVAANTVAYSASANTVTLQPQVAGALTDITVLYGIDATQNTRLGHVELAAANAYTQANTANVVAYSASANTIALQPYTTSAYAAANSAQTAVTYTQGGLDRANTRIDRLDNLNDWQNTQITQTSTRLDAAFARANSTSSISQSAYNQANTSANLANYLQGALNTANANIDIVSLTNITQNTRVTVLSDRVDAAYAAANSAQTISQLAFNAANATNVSANISYLQGAINTANANISLLFAINNAQNNNINTVSTRVSTVFERANDAFLLAFGADSTATDAALKGQYLQGALNTANSSISYQAGVNTTQNTRISAIDNYSQSAYARANSTITYSEFAFSQANNALTEAFEAQAKNILQDDELLHVRGIAQAAYDYANNYTFNPAAFNKANAATDSAQSAFNKANSANSLAQAAFNKANGVTTITGNNTWLQYNNNGVFGSSANLRFDSSTNTLFVPNINVGSGMLNIDGSIELDGDISPKVLGQNLGDISHRWYNLYIDGGIYADGSFGRMGQILSTDGYGTLRWVDANNIVVSGNTGGNVDFTVYNIDPWARQRVNSTSSIANTALNIAEAAFIKSNSVYQVDTVARTDISFLSNYTQVIYSKANDTTILAQAAFDKANSANVTISSTDSYARQTANAAFDKANSVQSYAQVAYSAANNSYVRAQAAFDKANSVQIFTQAAFDKANSQQSSINSAHNKANLAISTVETFSGSINDINNKIQYQSNVDGTQNTRISQALALAQQALDATVPSNVDQFARNTANSSFNYAAASFETANVAYGYAAQAIIDATTALNQTTNAVQRPGDTMTGTLRISGGFPAVNTNSGDLILAGGAGVAGAIFAGSLYSTDYGGIIDAGTF
jgi:hypothetical protein